NYEDNRPTPAQIETAAAIYAYGRGRWWVDAVLLRSHRDVSKTACPGQYVHAARTDILVRAARLVNRPVGGGAPSVPTPTVPSLPTAPSYARKKVPTMLVI